MNGNEPEDMRSDWLSEIVRCPRCSGDISITADTARCTVCGEICAIENETLYCVSEAPYWGEITREKMHRLIALCREYGWRAGLERFCREDPSPCHSRLLEKLHDSSTTNWSALIGLDPGGVVMDLGAGLGTMACSFGRSFEHVVACEQVSERIAFMRSRVREEGLENRVRVVCADAFNLPFAEGTFDLISLNGVLEWLPLACTSYDPEESQRRMIRSAFKLLKPGGVLYVGIEARYALRLLVGGRGPHDEGRFIACLPRWWAQWCHRRKKDSQYRTYIHSPKALGRMLEKEGFHKVDVLNCSPGYNKQRYIVPLSSRKALKFKFECLRHRPLGSRKWEVLRKIIQWARLERITSEQVIVLGFKEQQ